MSQPPPPTPPPSGNHPAQPSGPPFTPPSPPGTPISIPLFRPSVSLSLSLCPSFLSSEYTRPSPTPCLSPRSTFSVVRFRVIKRAAASLGFYLGQQKKLISRDAMVFPASAAPAPAPPAARSPYLPSARRGRSYLAVADKSAYMRENVSFISLRFPLSPSLSSFLRDVAGRRRHRT